MLRTYVRTYVRTYFFPDLRPAKAISQAGYAAKGTSQDTYVRTWRVHRWRLRIMSWAVVSWDPPFIGLPACELSEKYVRAYLSDDGGLERARELPPSASLKGRAIPAHARLRTHCASGVPCMYVRGNYVRTYMRAYVRASYVRTQRSGMQCCQC